MMDFSELLTATRNGTDFEFSGVHDLKEYIWNGCDVLIVDPEIRDGLWILSENEMKLKMKELTELETATMKKIPVRQDFQNELPCFQVAKESKSTDQY